MARARLTAALVLLAACDGGGDRFEDQVVPLLESRCLSAACHGVLPDAEAGGEYIDWSFFFVRIDERGRVIDPAAARATALGRADTRVPALSTLLRKPLATEAGGQQHLGGVQFAGTGDDGYRVLHDWLAGESGGGEGTEELTALEQRFGDEVLPHLAARQCMNAACHGPTAPFTGFDAPVIIDGAPVFSPAAIRRNHHLARIHLHLGGDPRQSRIVRKTLPIEAGGIAHRGGNDIFFFPGADGEDPAITAITGWADAERSALLGGSDLPQVTGYVFVRGPLAAERPFALDGAFQPGSDLWVMDLPGGQLRNLTATAHPEGPAEVRDPAVSHDGARVAFAMRRTAAEAWNLWLIGVDGSGLRQLGSDPAALFGGGLAASAQPTWGPDGNIYYVSTRAGQLADGRDQLDTEIWAVDPDGPDGPDGGEPQRWTHDPQPVATPSFIGTGKSYGTLAFTLRRTVGGRFEAPVLRMPLDHNRAYHGDPELHIHHGLTAGADALLAMRTLPDGRFTGVLVDRDNRWRGGRPVIFDRQFGPDLTDPDATAAVGGFRHAFTALDESIATGGASAGGLWRHPVPLPDGRLLVTRAPGPVDLSDPAADPELGLYLVTLAEDPQTGRPAVAAIEALVDEPGIDERDAEPIVVRPLEDDPAHEPAWDPSRTETTGVLAYRHVETLEAIMSGLPPRGPRPLRDDLAFARLIEAIDETPALAAAAPAGLGESARARILAEVPLAGGSMQLELPAGRPFRIQFLDARRMAVGAQHNRWISVDPGGTFPGGVSPALYPALCSGCHGSISGDPAEPIGPVPDAVTAASITLATHQGMNPRRPLPPRPVGEADAIEVDFARDLAPLLSRSCAGCHGGSAPAGGLDVDPRPTASFDTAYEALLAPGAGSRGGRMYVDELGTSARGSYLIERMLGAELDAPRALGGACPGEPPLSEEEQLQFIRWIEVGAPYRGALP